MKAFEGSVIHDVCNLVTLFYLSCLLSNVKEKPENNAGNVPLSDPCASVTALCLGFPFYLRFQVHRLCRLQLGGTRLVS